MPVDAGPDRLPGDLEDCENDIYGAMIEQCGSRSQYNVGSINVEQLPSGPAQPGRPMTEGYLRYIMAPIRL